MTYNFPENIKNMTPYEPITGEYKIRLDANESYINLSDEQKKELNERVNNLDFNRYPDPYAVKLCKAFGDLYNVNPNLVTAGNGSDELIALLCGTFFTKDDTVAVFSNDFSMYRVYCETYGVKCKVIPKREDLTIDVSKALEFIEHENISAIIFSNPCNPTSIGLTKDKVRCLINNTSALVILDEAYMDFWDESLLSEVENYKNLIILKTCSKSIGLAGIRLGFLIANKEITSLVRAVKSPYNVNTITQTCGEVILSDKAAVLTAAKEIVENKNELESEIKKLASSYPEEILNVYNSNTNFVFLKVKNGGKIFEELLNRGVAIRFMGEYLRISTGSEEENKALLENLRDILERGADE